MVATMLSLGPSRRGLRRLLRMTEVLGTALRKIVILRRERSDRLEGRTTLVQHRNS
jgi:hypothetical protein